MSFSYRGSRWWLEGGHILHATLQDNSGYYKDSFIDLNLYIGNYDGNYFLLPLLLWWLITTWVTQKRKKQDTSGGVEGTTHSLVGISD